MGNWTRRRLLGALASFGLVAPAALRLPSVVKASGADGQSTQRAPLALSLVRLLNTVENRVFKEGKKYVELAALLQSSAMSVYQARETFKAIRPGSRELIPGYVVSLAVNHDESVYRLVVEAVDGTTSYWSDSEGVIYAGAVKHVAAGGDHLIPGLQLTGQPIQNLEGTTPNKFQTTIGRVAGFFVPTLYADHCNDCSGCATTQQCIQVCLKCCNLGVGGCPWCCALVPDCDCTIVP